MKGGHTPIHFMRWAPSDYVNDPWVKLAASRNDTGALTVYHLFLNYSFMEGGYLPSDPKLLAVVLGISAKTVLKSLGFWSAPSCGLIKIKDGRAWNTRVLRDVLAELRFRRSQAASGTKGGLARAGRLAQGKPKGSSSPPSPSPSPSPAPSPLTETETEDDDETRARDRALSPATLDEAKCPDCHVSGTLRRGRGDGGWFCGTKLGGCNAQFRLDDAAILVQIGLHARAAIEHRVARAPAANGPVPRPRTAAETTVEAVRQVAAEAEAKRRR